MVFNSTFNIFSEIAVFIIIIGMVIISVLLFKHWPKHKLNKKCIERIKQYGLIHFTKKNNIQSILKEGLKPNLRKPMSFLEKDLVWMYVADPLSYEDCLREIHSKGDRSKYDTVILIHDISDEDIGKMRWRKKPEAVVHIGTFKTTKMEAKDI